MADPVNDAPMTSYSDPFYDRIDAIYQSVKARWPIFLFVLILVVVITVIVGARLAHRPDAAGAHDYHSARQEPDKDKRRAALEKIATTSESQAFRVIALNDLVQEDLQRDDLAAARKHADQAVELAKQGEDLNLKLTTLNSLGAVQFQAGEFDQSAATFKGVVTRAGSQPKFAAEKLHAQLGQAQALVRAGKVEDALAVLDPLLNKSSAGAEELLNQARAYYWRLKREQAEAKLPKPSPAPSAVKPVEPVKPAEPAKPVEPVQAAEPVKPAEPAKSAETPKPVPPAEAVKVSAPAQPAAPTPAVPAPAADPAKDGASGKNPIGR